ncbi:MAG: 5'/3'-nucleotidase SurE [Nannocystaceae bacterium]|nr:5'/3'-nucleotidase SurE [Nannocystaceae bacterium]
MAVQTEQPKKVAGNARPLILVSNDDGVHAAGLAVLVSAMASLGDVIVSAPDSERSGASHSMTFHSHLRASETSQGWWAVSGTPVDCVYFGMIHLCTARAPDLVVSGINAGYNLGTDVFYSGTVGAAAEGRLRGCSGLAVSTERGVDPRWAAHASRAIAKRLLDSDTPQLLSVNVPFVPGHEHASAAEIDRLSGAMRTCVTRLGHRSYEDRVHRREDPHGRPYYWIGGPPSDMSGKPGDDLWAVAQGMVSVTPLVLDITAPDLQGTHALLTADPELDVVALPPPKPEPT